MTETTDDTPAITIVRLVLNGARLTWEDIRAIAEHEIKHRDILDAGLDLVDDAEIAAWNQRAELNRAWFERNL